MKSVQLRSFFWSVFSCIQTEYRDLWSKSPYSVRIQENTDEKKLRNWTIFTQWEKYYLGGVEVFSSETFYPNSQLFLSIKIGKKLFFFQGFANQKRQSSLGIRLFIVLYKMHIVLETL